jgi:hypothetical protein
MAPAAHTAPAAAEGALRTAIGALGFAALGGVLFATASLVPFGGLGLLALAPLLARSSSLRGGERAARARPLAALVASPVLLGLPLFMAVDPVASNDFVCGTALVGLLFVFPVLAFLTGVVASAAALGAAVTMPRVLARCAPIVRNAALIAGALLLLAGAARLGRAPAPEDWVAGLPEVARLVLPGAQGPTAEGPAAEGPGRHGGVVAWPLDVAGEPRTLRARCREGLCRVSLGGDHGELLGAAEEALEVSATSPLEVRAHEAMGVVVLVQGSRPLGAFHLEGGERTGVRLHQIAGEVAPSFLALLAMAIGLLAAGGRVRRGVGERAAVGRLLAGTAGFVDEAGVVHPDDDSPAFRPAGAPLPEGPALILGRPGADAFRSGPNRSVWVLPGRREEHLAAHRSRAERFDWEAAAAVALGAGPLAAAALQGLVL